MSERLLTQTLFNTFFHGLYINYNIDLSKLPPLKLSMFGEMGTKQGYDSYLTTYTIIDEIKFSDNFQIDGDFIVKFCINYDSKKINKVHCMRMWVVDKSWRYRVLSVNSWENYFKDI